MGSYGALDPAWSSDAGINEVITLTTAIQKPTNLDWLKDDEFCNHMTVIIDADDDDDSDGSFVEFRANLGAPMSHLLSLMKKGDCDILIVDPTGLATSPAFLCVAMLLRFQQPITTSLAAIAVARPALKMSKSLRRGLETVQMEFNEKKMKRLDAKIRHAVVISNAF